MKHIRIILGENGEEKKKRGKLYNKNNNQDHIVSFGILKPLHSKI